MTRKNETSPAGPATAPRREWNPPRWKRLNTSAAELGVGDTVDLEGMS